MSLLGGGGPHFPTDFKVCGVEIVRMAPSGSEVVVRFSNETHAQLPSPTAVENYFAVLSGRERDFAKLRQMKEERDYLADLFTQASGNIGSAFRQITDPRTNAKVALDLFRRQNDYPCEHTFLKTDSWLIDKCICCGEERA